MILLDFIIAIARIQKQKQINLPHNKLGEIQVWSHLLSSIVTIFLSLTHSYSSTAITLFSLSLPPSPSLSLFLSLSHSLSIYFSPYPSLPLSLMTSFYSSFPFVFNSTFGSLTNALSSSGPVNCTWELGKLAAVQNGHYWETNDSLWGGFCSLAFCSLNTASFSCRQWPRLPFLTSEIGSCIKFVPTADRSPKPVKWKVGWLKFLSFETWNSPFCIRPCVGSRCIAIR